MLYGYDMDELAHLRIGELSRRSGVSPELLRAWERRYGLLRPARSSGGLRLYSSDDLTRVRAMQQHLADGLAAAEAAALAAREAPAADTAVAHDAATGRRDLDAALSELDEPRAHAVLDALLAASTTDWVIAEVVLPYLHELGQRWERREVTVAQEHFATSVLRGRLLGLARGWGRGFGHAAVLACAPGEQHDLGLIAFGLALRARGWRIVYLGSDTPIDALADVARLSRPAFVVLSAVAADRLRGHEDELRALAKRHRLCLGGAAANDATLDVVALRLTAGPIEEAERLTSIAGAPAPAA